MTSKRLTKQGTYETKWGTILIECVSRGDYFIRKGDVTLGRVVKRQGKGWRTEPDMAIIFTNRDEAISGAITNWYQKNKAPHGITKGTPT